MTQESDPKKISATRGDTATTPPTNDPPPPPPKLMAFAYASVGVASIVFIIETIFRLFSCGCKC